MEKRNPEKLMRSSSFSGFAINLRLFPLVANIFDLNKFV